MSNNLTINNRIMTITEKTGVKLESHSPIKKIWDILRKLPTEEDEIFDIINETEPFDLIGDPDNNVITNNSTYSPELTIQNYGDVDTGFFRQDYPKYDTGLKDVVQAYEKVIGKNVLEKREKELSNIQEKILSKNTNYQPMNLHQVTNKLIDYNHTAKEDQRFLIYNEEWLKQLAEEDEKQFIANKKWLGNILNFVSSHTQ